MQTVSLADGADRRAGDSILKGVPVSHATVVAPSRNHHVRVASVPANHVYVRHLTSPLGDDGVTRLDDPVSTDGSADRWWPPAMLSERWVEDHLDDFDLMHVHFGFDAIDPDDLDRTFRALTRGGKPLVYTAHDLRNPHHRSSEMHDRHLAVVMQHADAVLTLTEAAARVIDSRWHRAAVVVPHPHVVELDTITARTPRSNDEFVVGVHAKSVRPNMDPGAVVAALVPLVDTLPGLRVVVDVHREVADPGPKHDPNLVGLLTALAKSGAIELSVHDYYTDAELWTYLGGLDVSVLPYRFGTHSGWLEACYDLGTRVVAPTCGFYADQRPVLSYRQDETGLDADGLRRAVTTAYDETTRVQATVADRVTERAMIARTHRAVYRDVVSR